MISRNLKDSRTFVKEREFFVLENKVNFSEKIEPKAELAYFKTFEEAEDFMRNLELYPNGKTRFMNSRSARIVKYYEGGKNQCYNRNQHIFL